MVCSILIVEDEAPIALNLSQLLSSKGYAVHAPVFTGTDAISSVKTRKPDLVLMDIELPGGMNGIATASGIRAIADIPVIYLTAYTEEMLFRQACLTAPYGYIVKPFHERELTAIIEIALYRHSLDRKMKESEEKFRNLVEFGLEGILVTDMQGTVLLANNAAARLVDYDDYAGLIGKNVMEFIAPESREDVARDFAEVSRGHDRYLAEYQVISAKGRKVSVESIGKIISFEGKPADLVSLRDVTERERMHEALRQANRKLNLLSGITRHDIVNQLTVLQGYLTILEMKQPDPSLTTYLAGLRAAAVRISAMIRFTKEYEQVGVAVPAWADCRRLVDTAAKEVSSGTITVKNEIPAGTEIFVDPLIVRVFYNLIDNAVRYGGKITTLRFSVQAGADPVVICEDDGDGVPAGEKDRIFDRGFGKNTGMGLFLAREILAITGIAICESGEPGAGARFEMTVPAGAYRISPGAVPTPVSPSG